MNLVLLLGYSTYDERTSRCLSVARRLKRRTRRYDRSISETQKDDNNACVCSCVCVFLCVCVCVKKKKTPYTGFYLRNFKRLIVGELNKNHYI